MKSILTKYEQYSVFSGSPKETDHHLVFGRGGAWRNLSERFGLKIPLLNREHNMSSNGTINQIHSNPAAEKLSKMLGQVAYEEYYLAQKLSEVESEGLGYQSAEDWMAEARESFRHEFGESFL